MIVDAQAHLWKAESDDWKWVPGRKPQLPEPFTIEKLVALMDEAGVDRVVIVPPSWPGDRNDYGLEAASAIRTVSPSWAASRFIRNSAKLLPKWREQPGMVGVRLTFMREQAATAHQWRRRLVLARCREGRPAGHVFRPGQHSEVCADRRAASRARPDHRPHEPDAGNREGAANSRAPSTTWSSSRNIRTFRSSCRLRRTFVGGLPVA